MLINSDKKTVWQWRKDGAKAKSFCPDCNGELGAREGDIKIHHWYHKKASHDCPNQGETSWHLAWKLVYFSFRDWEIEHGITRNGNRYRIDAARPDKKLYREFVHSLSDSYITKNEDLKNDNIMWIFDGDRFVSERKKPLRGNNGYVDFLKPKAQQMFDSLGGYVFYAGKMYYQAKSKKHIFIMCESKVLAEMCKRFNLIKRSIENDGFAKTLSLITKFKDEKRKDEKLEGTVIVTECVCGNVEKTYMPPDNDKEYYYLFSLAKSPLMQTMNCLKCHNNYPVYHSRKISNNEGLQEPYKDTMGKYFKQGGKGGWIKQTAIVKLSEEDLNYEYTTRKIIGKNGVVYTVED